MNSGILTKFLLTISLSCCAYGLSVSESVVAKQKTDRAVESQARLFGTRRTNQPLNSACTTLTNLQGTCMRRLECIRNAGVASGFCGTYGVCCQINLACNGISRLKRTVITNPVPVPARCTYHFQPFSTNVCQLRIDFSMNLAQPVIPGPTNNQQFVTCVTDVFQVESLRLCGSNTNQHVYIPFDVANFASDLTLTFTISSTANNPSGAFWNLIVTQIECPAASRRTDPTLGTLAPISLNTLNDIRTFTKFPNVDTDLIAPPGCLQYFTERQGTVESFNYNNGQGPYLGNMRYAICFRRTASDTGIQFTANRFEIGAANEANGGVDTDCHDPFNNQGLPNDYLLVPESILSANPPIFGTRYCGTSLMNNELLYAPPGPFAIIFNSDNIYSLDPQEIGFRIPYVVQ